MRTEPHIAISAGGDGRGDVVTCSRCGVLRAYPMPTDEARAVATNHEQLHGSQATEVAA